MRGTGTVTVSRYIEQQLAEGETPATVNRRTALGEFIRCRECSTD